mgnify:CR=1 FL=1
MKRTLVLGMSMLIVSGCVSGSAPLVESRPLCEETADLRSNHAGALAEDGGPRSVSTGRALIATIDAGCADA